MVIRIVSSKLISTLRTGKRFSCRIFSFIDATVHVVSGWYQHRSNRSDFILRAIYFFLKIFHRRCVSITVKLKLIAVNNLLVDSMDDF